MTFDIHILVFLIYDDDGDDDDELCDLTSISLRVCSAFFDFRNVTQTRMVSVYMILQVGCLQYWTRWFPIVYKTTNNNNNNKNKLEHQIPTVRNQQNSKRYKNVEMLSESSKLNVK